MSRMTLIQRDQARRRFEAGEGVDSLAHNFRVSRCEIGRAVRGHDGLLTDDEVREMRRRVSIGETGAAMADFYHLSPSYAYRLLRGEVRLAVGGPIKGIDYD